MVHGDIHHLDAIHHLRMLTSVQGTNLATSLAVINPYWTLEDRAGEDIMDPSDEGEGRLSVLTPSVVSLVMLARPPPLTIFLFTSVISS